MMLCAWSDPLSLILSALLVVCWGDDKKRPVKNGRLGAMVAAAGVVVGRPNAFALPPPRRGFSLLLIAVLCIVLMEVFQASAVFELGGNKRRNNTTQFRTTVEKILPVVSKTISDMTAVPLPRLQS